MGHPEFLLRQGSEGEGIVKPVGAGTVLSGGGFLSRRFGSAFVPVGAGVDEAWSGDACVALVLVP